MEYFILM